MSHLQIKPTNLFLWDDGGAGAQSATAIHTHSCTYTVYLFGSPKKDLLMRCTACMQHTLPLCLTAWQRLSSGLCPNLMPRFDLSPWTLACTHPASVHVIHRTLLRRVMYLSDDSNSSECQGEMTSQSAIRLFVSLPLSPLLLSVLSVIESQRSDLPTPLSRSTPTFCSDCPLGWGGSLTDIYLHGYRICFQTGKWLLCPCICLGVWVCVYVWMCLLWPLIQSFVVSYPLMAKSAVLCDF